MYALTEPNGQVGYTPVPAASIPAPVPGVDDPRYRCICGLMHVHTGVLAIAVFEILFFVAFTVACFVGVFGQGVNTLGVLLLISTPAFVVCGLLILAIIKKRRALIIPHMFVQVMLIFACLVSSLIYLSFIARSEEYDTGDKIYTIATIICVVFSFVEVWFFYVIWLAYKCLGDW